MMKMNTFTPTTTTGTLLTVLLVAFRTMVTAQEFCRMCESGVPSRTTTVIPFLAIGSNDNPTCAEVADFGIEEVSSEDDICKVIRDHANFCGCPEATGVPPNHCTLCPDQANPANLNSVSPYDDTCGELDSYIRFLPEDLCATERVASMQRADAFCGCPGVVADCYMCSDNTNNLDNPDRLVPFYEFLSNSFSTPCQELADFYTLYDTEDPEISTCEFVQLESVYCGCASNDDNTPSNTTGVCEDRSVPLFPLKFIDEIQMTCGELDRYLNHQPADQAGMPWNVDLQRFDYYCGCATATAPCPICPDGTTDVSKPDAIVPYLIIPNNENPTCKQLATLGVIAAPGELVLEDCAIFETQSDFCGCPNASPPVNACEFCPGGVDPPNPTLVTPFGDTCSELSEYLSYLPADQCTSERVGFMQRQDFLCGCPSATTNCPLCPNDGTNNIEYSDRRVPLLSLPLNTNPTCQEVIEFMAVNDGDLSQAGCSALQGYAGYCGCSQQPRVGACSFCPNGGSPANPGKVVSELFTCEGLFDFVSFLPAEDCGSDAADFAQIEAFAYTCGCPGAEPSCTLCSGDGEPAQGSLLTMDGETTCTEFAELVRSLTPDQCVEDSDLIAATATECGCAGGSGSSTTDQAQCAIQQNAELCTTSLLDSTDAVCDCYAFCDSSFVKCQSAQGGLLRTDECAGTPITGCNSLNAISAGSSQPASQDTGGDNGSSGDKNTTAIIASAVVIPVVLALLVAIYAITTRKSKAEADKINAVETDPEASALPVSAMEGSLSMADVGAVSPSSVNGGSIMTDTSDLDAEGETPLEADPERKMV